MNYSTLILRTAPEFIRGVCENNNAFKPIYRFTVLLCKADSPEKTIAWFVMFVIFEIALQILIFHARTSGNSFQQVVKAGLRDLLRALQSELPETEAEATV